MNSDTSRSWIPSGLAQRFLAAFLVVSLVPLALTAGLTYWQTTRQLQGYVAENVGRTATAYAADVDVFLEQKRLGLRSVGADPADMAARVERDPDLMALFWTDGIGTLMQSTGPIDPWALEACHTMWGDAEGPMTHAGEGHAHEVVVAVKHGAHMLCGQVTFTPHQDMMNERARSLVGGVAYIVDRSGRVVCHSVDDAEPHVERGSELAMSVTEVAERGVAWEGLTQTADGLAFAAFAPSTSLPWGVWVEVPRDVAAGPLRASLGRTLAIVVGFALVVCVVAVVLVRRLVAPIEQFRERTAELQAAREFSDLLLDTMRERILVIDDGLGVVRANDAAQQAYGSDVVGCGCSTVHGTDPEHCPARRVLESGEPASEERVREHDGGTEILAVDTYPIPDPSGRPKAVVEIARDVTELKRFQARLMQQEKLASLGTMAAGLAHEIGNPLASLSSELEMLEKLWDPDEARASLPVLRDQIRRMSGLLRELVDYGRQSSDRATVFAPGELLADVARLVRHDPRAKEVRVDVEVASDLQCLCSSRDRLVQVLVNLGLNALDAVDSGGSVIFGACEEPTGEIRLTVRDDGPGIPEDAAKHVFDPFYTTKPPGEGTGLGLFVSQRIVQALGGRIELDSPDEGGTTFGVVLPACACGGES